MVIVLLSLIYEKKNADGNAQEELMLVNRLIPIAVHCLDPTCSYISREVHVR